MKLSDKIYLVFIVSTILAIATFLSGCKSSKHAGCDAYSDTYLIETDSMIVKVEHCHVTEKSYCSYSTDTIYSKK